MAAVAAARASNSSSSISGSSSYPPQVSSSGEKASRNKRKFRTETPLGDGNKLSFLSSQIECVNGFEAQNAFSHEHGGCDLCSHHKQEYTEIFKPEIRISCGPGLPSEVVASRVKEEQESEEFHDADWSDLTEGQLEELVLNTLDTIFKSVIKKIIVCGYIEEVAMKAILRSGLCYGYKDTVTNIVDNTLNFLRNGQEVDPSRDHFFENLEQLEKYILAEMVCVLREVRPFFSTGDAMWLLLICDMNVNLACAMEGDPFSTQAPDENPGCSSTNSTLPHLESDGNSLESQTSNADKQAETPTMPDIPDLPNPKNPVVLEGLPPEKSNSSLTSDAKEKSSGSSGDRNQTCSQSSAQEDNPVLLTGGGRKGHSHTSNRESILGQKSIHLDKNYRAYGPKGVMRTGKLSSLGGLILDKKHKSISVTETIGVDLKHASLKISKAVGVDLSQPGGTLNISAPLNFAKRTGGPKTKPAARCSLPKHLLPKANTELSLSSSPPQKNASSKTPSSSTAAPNYNFLSIPYDKTLGQFVPEDEKDEVILKLAPRVRELQNQLQEWTEWANQKVMQAARRLSKDKAELKTLRQEKEEVTHLKKEKQALEENTMKKLSEMDSALGKATGQVERANMTVRRLEVENPEQRREMEVAKVRAAESAASCVEVSKREKKTLQKFQTWDKQKTLFQEELVTEKRKLAQLQQEVEHATDARDQMEARRKQEEMLKEKYLAQASSIKKERLQIVASAKSKEDMIKMKAEQDLQIYKEDIRKLEAEIAQIRLKNDSSKIAALRQGIDGSYVSRVTDGENALIVKGGTNQTQHISGTMADLNEYSGCRDVKRERECVMCLSEEMSVVFLPCAHQVVCTKCNDLHEKQGMKDCPSCRTPIQRRILLRYARS